MGTAQMVMELKAQNLRLIQPEIAVEAGEEEEYEKSAPAQDSQKCGSENYLNHRDWLLEENQLTNAPQ